MTYGEEIKAGRFVVELWNAHARQGSMDWLNICSRMIFEHDKAIRAEARAEAFREAADIAENILKNCPRDKYEGYMILPGIFRAAITQEPKP
jgi:hypothetical protein